MLDAFQTKYVSAYIQIIIVYFLVTVIRALLTTAATSVILALVAPPTSVATLYGRLVKRREIIRIRNKVH